MWVSSRLLLVSSHIATKIAQRFYKRLCALSSHCARLKCVAPTKLRNHTINIGNITDQLEMYHTLPLDLPHRQRETCRNVCILSLPILCGRPCRTDYSRFSYIAVCLWKLLNDLRTGNFLKDKKHVLFGMFYVLIFTVLATLMYM